MTLTSIQQSISALLEAEREAPVPGSEDWLLRKEIINIAQTEWARSKLWDVLYKEVHTRTSQSTGFATVALPSNFYKLSSHPRIVKDGSTYEYPEIDPQTRTQYTDTEKFVYILGDDAEGYKMIVHPPSVASGASIFYSYWATPSSLASPTDVTIVPDPNYLVYATVARLSALDNDSRADVMRMEAERILIKMEGQQNVRGYAYWDRVKTMEETRHGFRWGKN